MTATKVVTQKYRQMSRQISSYHITTIRVKYHIILQQDYILLPLRVFREIYTNSRVQTKVESKAPADIN